MSITPDFRLFHVSDGTPVAEAIAKKFSGDRYNLRVELYDLQRRSSSLCGSSSSPPSSAQSSHSKAHLSVLLVTPAMIKHWNGAGNDGRSPFIQYLGTNTRPVAISCFVPRNLVEAQIKVVFPQSSLEWRHLEVGLSSSSFNHCVIGLISLLEEEHEPMPMPMLKKCHLLPKKPVMVGDTMYIQLEDELPEFMDSSSLSVVFDHDLQISANRIGNCLYEFHLPECSQLTSTLTIYTSNGECLGTEDITYRDRAQLLSTILSDVLNPVEFMSQALQLNQVSPEMIDAKLAFWFKYKHGDTIRTESQRIMNQWMKVIKCTKGSLKNSCQELPTLLHLSAKYNLSLLAESLLTHPWAALALKMQNKDGLRPDQLALKYHHNSLSEFLAAENEADNSSSYDEEDIYVHPDYSTPEGLLRPNDGDAIFYFDFDFDPIRLRKNSSGSTHEEERSNSCKHSPTCPPVRSPRRNPPPVSYVNTSPHTSQCSCSKNAAETLPSEKPVPMLSKAISHGRHHSLDSADTQANATRSFESTVQQPRPKPRQRMSDKITKSSRSSGELSVGRPATPPRPPQPLKVFISPENKQNNTPKCTVISQQNDGDYILMQRIKPSFLMPPRKVRRSSVSLTLQQNYSPPLKSSLSLSGLNERVEEMNFTLSTRRAAKDLAMSPTFLGTLTPSKYPSKPRRSLPQSPLASPASPSPPPLPATPPPRTSNLPPKSDPPQPHQPNHKPTSQSNPTGYSQRSALPQPHVVYLSRKSPSARKFANLSEPSGGQEDMSPDYSQPINVHFDDVPGARALSCDYISPVNDEEAIYEDVDSQWEMTHNGDVSFIRAKSTRGRQSFRKVIVVEKSTIETMKQTLADDPQLLATSPPMPSSPTSPKSPLSPHFFPLTKSLSTLSLSSHESQPKSPSLFATLTSKFSSKRKQSKATKDQATHM